MLIGLILLILSFTVGYIVYPRFIHFLKQNTVEQKVSEYALDAFKDKESTVTFGGLVFVVVSVVMMVVMRIFNLNINILLVLLVFVAYGFLGFIDDYKIIKEGKNDGLSPKFKLVTQCVLALIFYLVYMAQGGSSVVSIPLIHVSFDLGILYLPFILIMFSGYSNAVNLTDGMDGLATGTSIVAFIPFIYFTHIQGLYELGYFLYAVIGALMAFLVYNYKPAKIFMGDVGSLALGALFAMVAVYTKMEVLSIIIGGVFVFETLTVTIQQIAVRTIKRRVFKYTPIHYSFTLSGWREIDVVHFFWGLGVFCAALGLVIGLVG